MKDLGPSPSIIPALDVTLDQARALVDTLRPARQHIAGYKVGSLLVMRNGLAEVVRSLSSDVPLILDMQKHGTDIPDIVERQVRLAAESGVAAVIGAPLGAGSHEMPSGSLETFAAVCKETGTLPIVVVEMSHPGADEFLHHDASVHLAERLVQLEVGHVVAPATKPKSIRRVTEVFESGGIPVRVVSPGVGPQKTGNAPEDARNAVLSGADYIVVGRAIYNSEDPLKALTDIHDALG